MSSGVTATGATAQAVYPHPLFVPTVRSLPYATFKHSARLNGTGQNWISTVISAQSFHREELSRLERRATDMGRLCSVMPVVLRKRFPEQRQARPRVWVA